MGWGHRPRGNTGWALALIASHTLTGNTILKQRIFTEPKVWVSALRGFQSSGEDRINHTNACKVPNVTGVIKEEYMVLRRSVVSKGESGIK